MCVKHPFSLSVSPEKAIAAFVELEKMAADKQEQRRINQAKLIDSLTDEQRKVIAEIIREADIESEWHWNGEGSVCEDDASATLESLASYFETYDPTSAID